MSGQWEITLSLGEGVPGRELLCLLEEIGHTGSLSRAADRAGLSYRYAWGLLNRAEAALGKELVTRRAGGAAGGGSELTGDGESLLGHLRLLQRQVHGQIASLLDGRRGPEPGQLLLASTMEPVATGLLDILEQSYFQETGVMVRHVAAGSGQALALARAGRVDAAITHAPGLEEEFVRQGFGIRRVPFMHNDFLLVGHTTNPAVLSGNEGILDALRCIAAAQAPFVSRGDQSGTHLLEQQLWHKAGLDPGRRHWYHLSRSVLGSLDALRNAVRLQGYTLVDRSSYLSAGSALDLTPFIQGEQILINIFSVTVVNRNMAPVNQKEAEMFASWLSGPRAADLIDEFGRREFGSPLFLPLR